MLPIFAALALTTADPTQLYRPPPEGDRPLTPIYGVSTGDRGVTVRLPYDCNVVKSDFTVALSKAVDRPTLRVVRRSPTTSLVVCKREPGAAMAMTWSYDELGLKPGQSFSLANPIVTTP